MPRPIPDRNVDAIRRQRYNVCRRINHQINVRVGCAKPSKARHEPARRKCRRHRDMQRPCIQRICHFCYSFMHLRKSASNFMRQPLPLGREPERATRAVKQGNIQMPLQHPQLLADRGM